MRKPGKLLIVSFSTIPENDAHTSRVTETVRALRRLFNGIDIVTVKGGYLSHIERFHGARLLRVPLLGETAAEKAESFQRAVRRQIESETYEVVHIRGPIEGLPICDADEDSTHRVVFEAGCFTAPDSSFHAGPTEELSALEPQMRKDEIHCAKRADLVIVQAEAAVAALEERGVTTPVSVVHRGVNVDFYDWETPWETEAPTLLCLGDLSPWRDVHGVVEALRIIRGKHPVFLRWVGEPDEKKRDLVTRYAEEQELGESVLFSPPAEREALPRMISSATLCIAPAAPAERYSEWGACPGGLLEFLACKRPVVVARTPGAEEVVEPEVAAAPYEPGDPKSLAKAVNALLRSPKKREALAEAGYQRVRAKFSASAERRSILNEYLELLEMDPARPLSRDLNRSADSTAPAADPSDVPLDVDTAIIRDDAETSRMQLDGDTKRFESREEHRDTEPSIELEHVADEEPTGARLQVSDPPLLPEDETGKVVTQRVEAAALLNEDTSRIQTDKATTTSQKD